MTERSYSVEDIAAIAGVTVRTVRYYIQSGLLAHPQGSRRVPRYTDRHLEALLRIRRLSEEGRTLTEIGRLMQSEVRSECASAADSSPRPGSVSVRRHIALCPGAELVIDMSQAALSPEAVQRIIREALAIAESDRLTNGSCNPEGTAPGSASALN